MTSTSATPAIRCHLSADDPRAGLVAAVGEDGAADPLGVEALEVLRVVGELGGVRGEAGEEDGGGRAPGQGHFWLCLVRGAWRPCDAAGTGDLARTSPPDRKLCYAISTEISTPLVSPFTGTRLGRNKSQTCTPLGRLLSRYVGNYRRTALDN